MQKLIINEDGTDHVYECADGFVSRCVAAVHHENFADARRVCEILNKAAQPQALHIAYAERDSAILVCDEDNNDIAEFYHNEHATVGQSYETALKLANALVAAAA